MGKFIGKKSGVQPKVTFSNIPTEYKQPGSSYSGGGFKLPITRKYGQSEYKDLASAEALERDISDIERLVRQDKESYAKNKNPFKTGQFLGGEAFTFGPLKGITKRGQEFALMKKSVGERLLRLRSGAQINEKEYKRFMDMLPTIMRDDDIDLKQLGRFKQEFDSIQGRIKQGSLYNPKSKGFDISEADIKSTMKANNMTREQVLQALGVQ